MGDATSSNVQCYFSLLTSLLLCSWFLHPSQAFKVRTSIHLD